MKNAPLFALLLTFLFGTSVSGQLRVDPSGRIGIGTTLPNSGYKVHVKGDLLLTTYPEVPAYPGGTFIEMKMKVGNGNPGAEIGTNVDKIAFWSSETGWNKIYAEQFYTMSDSSSKMNLRKVDDALHKVLQLNGYKYETKSHGHQNPSARYGLLAQEVRDILPEATDSAKGILMVDYSQLIALLVEAIKTESDELDSLKMELSDLREQMLVCCSSQMGSEVIGAVPDDTVRNVRLFQNRPNPFRDRTVIEFELPTPGVRSASIMIFDMNGSLKLGFPVASSGRGSIVVEGSRLVAGMYLYSLVVDGVEVETKRMILTD